MNEYGYNPKDDVNVLLLTESKELKKLTRINLHMNPMLETPQLLVLDGFITDMTKDGIILLSFVYTNEKREDIIHFKKSIKFFDIESVESDVMCYDTDFFKKVIEYLKFASTYCFNKPNDIDLEAFSSTKYHDFIVSSNNLITFDDEIKNNKEYVLTGEDIELLQMFIEDYNLKESSEYIKNEKGEFICSCGKDVEEDMKVKNKAVFQSDEHGLCKDCWEKIMYAFDGGEL